MSDPSRETGDRERAIARLRIELDETQAIATARNRLLKKNIDELNDVYNALREKLKEVKRQDRKIKDFEESLVRANKLAALGEMAGSIAHEIKNPLISIQGFADRIGKTDDREKIERYARLISKEAGRLSKVLVTLLDFARMNEPKREREDMNAIIDDTVLFMEHHLTRFRNITLTVETAKELPLVTVDKVQIQQTLVNIMMNAAQAMPDGGTITITTDMTVGSVAVRISDTGVGVSEDDMARIFEPFFTTKAKGEGTGLGLSLCKRFVELNGGTIRVESIPGQGTTFELLFPPAEQRSPGAAIS